VYGLPLLQQHAANDSFIYSVPAFVTNLAYAAYDLTPPETVGWLLAMELRRA
jgi:hypothetical protein